MMLCTRTQIAAFYSGHSGQSPLVLNHIDPRYKDKVGSVSRCRIAGNLGTGTHLAENVWTETIADPMLRLMTLSARNRLEGKITELQLGGVMAHVVVRVGDNIIESVITRRSAEEMSLKVGDTVSAVIKSTEIMLEKK